MDIDKTTRVLSESLARSVDRRSFLRRAGQTAFFGLAALASGSLFKGTAEAASTVSKAPTNGSRPPMLPPSAGADVAPYCSPPNGFYCSRDGSNNPNGCHGANCYSYVYGGKLLSCDRDYSYYPGSGCWTARVTGGYWTCCDCKCATGATTHVSCGCAQFSSGPWPGLEGPAR